MFQRFLQVFFTVEKVSDRRGVETKNRRFLQHLRKHFVGTFGAEKMFFSFFKLKCFRKTFGKYASGVYCN